MQPRTALPETPLHALYRSGRSVSLSEQLVGEVRDALFARRLKPGDFLGTENELAARHGVSRMVARDALRTLQALGVAEIKMGKGGGARVARGNPPLLAEALAVQLELSGVTAAEILDAQCAIETLATELAAQHAIGAPRGPSRSATRRDLIIFTCSSIRRRAPSASRRASSRLSS